MRLHASVVASALLVSVASTAAFVPLKHSVRGFSSVKSAVVEETKSLTYVLISKLRYRELQRELLERDLDASGTLSSMRGRLREVTCDPSKDSDENCIIDEEKLTAAFKNEGIEFQAADHAVEFNDLVKETLEKAEQLHWNAAIRKLKTLTRRFGPASSDPRTIPEEVYTTTLKACSANRMHRSRAADPARKIMEGMVEAGYQIPTDAANFCIKNCLSDGPNGANEGHGGIDTALAMLAAVHSSENPPIINPDTYSKLITTMADDGSIDDALNTLRELVVQNAETPSLQLFAYVASACVRDGAGNADKVLTVLAYAKACGYELDSVASTAEGRQLLAAGVIAAELLNNIALGLRLLTAASLAEGCAPDRGDALIASSSSKAQRAATILHRQAINKAVEDNQWKLAVKLLELMMARSLTPSPSVWRNVVICCAKAEKSRKATALLLDWITLAGNGRAEKPPLRVFNSVVNACEICGEEALTIRVLDAMQDTHDTEGNIYTFNIALKRLAKQGSTTACEGIIIGMLQSGIEPSVVSYTTAIAACVADPKRSDIAAEWLNRMRSRKVQPNVITYNTALASCLDGTLEGTMRASSIASEMLADIDEQLDRGVVVRDQYTNIIPNVYTKTLGRQVMMQLKSNWESGAVDKKIAKSTFRVPLLKLVEFQNTETAGFAKKQAELVMGGVKSDEEDQIDATTVGEEELEFSTALRTHRAAAV